MCDCSKKAKSGGYKVFGLGFYGECWAGMEKTFNQSPISMDCVQYLQESCNDADDKEVCIGKADVEFVYMSGKLTGNLPVFVSSLSLLFVALARKIGSISLT